MRKRTSSTKRFREQARQKRQEDKDRRRAERKAAKEAGIPEPEPTAETAGLEDEYREQDAGLDEPAEGAPQEGAQGAEQPQTSGGGG